MDEKKKNILVLNMGMKSIRSIVFSPAGEKMGTASRPLKTYLEEGRVEQDPVEWWEKAHDVVRDSLVDIPVESIGAMTVTASSSCLVCVDADGNAIGKCIMVSDKRAAGEAERMKSCSSFSAVQEKTGIGADACLMLPKILWVKKNRPAISKKTAKFLSPDDFLLMKLTGKTVTDPFNAQKYHYDVQEQSYPEALLREFGVDRRTLPDVCKLGGGHRSIDRSGRCISRASPRRSCRTHNV